MPASSGSSGGSGIRGFVRCVLHCEAVTMAGGMRNPVTGCSSIPVTLPMLVKLSCCNRPCCLEILLVNTFVTLRIAQLLVRPRSRDHKEESSWRRNEMSESVSALAILGILDCKWATEGIPGAGVTDSLDWLVVVESSPLGSCPTSRAPDTRATEKNFSCGLNLRAF